MALSFTSRTVGEVTVIECHGRLVEGDESSSLDAFIRSLLPMQPYVVLDLTSVSFIDSAGLGLLIRLRTLTRGAAGDLKLSGAGSRIRQVLNITRLAASLPVHETDAEAITAFYRTDHSGKLASSFDVDILCVHQSRDVLAYMRELLKQASYGVATATNLSDARTLLRATGPRVVVCNPDLHGEAMTAFLADLTPSVHVVDIPAGFSTDDAGAAGRELLDRVHSAVTA
jgi:anti-sigma B factor antagonist